MYSLGWRVFRDHVGRSVPADRRRRSVRVGVLVALAACVVLVALGLIAGWPDLADGADDTGVALLALALGVFGAACVPLRPRTADGSRLYWGSAMVAPESSERYFRRGPAPTIDPADRDDVLRDALAIRAGLVPEVHRGLLALAAVVLAFAALVLLGAPTHVVVWVGVITAVRTVVTLIRLGRVERAQALAEVLPDARRRDVARSVRPGRPGTRSGSKLSLPGDDR